jgi:hypothetical protein
MAPPRSGNSVNGPVTGRPGGASGADRFAEIDGDDRTGVWPSASARTELKPPDDDHFDALVVRLVRQLAGRVERVDVTCAAPMRVTPCMAIGNAKTLGHISATRADGNAQERAPSVP